ERELAAGADSEHTADNALLAHADTHHRAIIAGVLQELHHGHVVIETRGRADDLDEVRRILLHALESLVEVLGAAEIVIRKNQSRPAAQLLDLTRLQLCSGLKRKIHNLA